MTHNLPQNPGILSLKEIDNLDDRREIFYLLSRLTPLQRIAFLYWCCDQANNRMIHRGEQTRVDITDPTGDPYHTMLSIAMLHAQYNLPIQRVLRGLERAVRNPERIGPLLLD